MAEKKRTPGKKSGSKHKNAGRQRKTADFITASEEKGMHPNVRDEIWAVIIIALGVFLVVAFQTHAAGIVGEGLSTFFKGCLGAIAYVLPYYLILYGMLLFARKTIHIGRKSVILLFIILLTVSIINSARFLNPDTLKFGLARIGDFYKGGSRLETGGVFGMYIGSLLVKAFGVPGLYILSGLIIIICLLLIINTPISRFFEKAAEKRRQRKEALIEEEEIEEIQELPDAMLHMQESLAVSGDIFGVPERKKRFPFWPRKERQLEEDDFFYEEELQPAEKNSSKKKVDMGPAVSGESSYIQGRISKGQRNILAYMEDDELFGEDGTSRQASQYGTEDLMDDASLDRDPFGEMFNGFSGNSVSTIENMGQAEEYGLTDKDEAEIGRSGSRLFGLDEHAPGEEPPSVLEAEPLGISEIDDFPEPEKENLDGNAETMFRMEPSEEVQSPAAAGDSALPAVSGTSEIQETSPAEKLTNSQAAQASLDPEELNDRAAPAAVYKFPPIDLLNKGKAPQNKAETNIALQAKAMKLEETLKNFHIDAEVMQVIQGPAVTRYEIHPNVGVKVKSIVNLADDIALNLEAKSIRIEAPIPGKAAVGIEVENDKVNMVTIREIIDSKAFKSAKSKITFAVGKDIAGNAIVADLKGMPHLLIAGSTGSGKSVCVNSIIASILYKAKPEEVKLVLIDPKVVELTNYNGIPHLLIPVVTEPAKAAAALNWAVAEMEDRYKKFAKEGVRELASYNETVRGRGEEEEFLPQVVIIIDELADLMMAAPAQVEESICRLAQKARAAGMHLILATQRPSVNVITGVIKANVPSRIAFAVSSQFDSRTILDMAGAEKLVGKGDMLFSPIGGGKPTRVQGTFISDSEVHNVIEFVKGQVQEAEYADDVIDSIDKAGAPEKTPEDTDELLPEAIETVVSAGQASVSMLQRRFRIGYNRAARIVDMMEARGIIGPPEGSKPRQVLMTEAELQALHEDTKDLQEG